MAARKSKPAPIHPAIAALREVHAHAFPAIAHGACYASDLVHDERAIATYPESPFAWIATPHSTHMLRASALAPGRPSSDAAYLRAVVDSMLIGLTPPPSMASMSPMMISKKQRSELHVVVTAETLTIEVG